MRAFILFFSVIPFFGFSQINDLNQLKIIDFEDTSSINRFILLNDFNVSYEVVNGEILKGNPIFTVKKKYKVALELFFDYGLEENSYYQEGKYQSKPKFPDKGMSSGFFYVQFNNKNLFLKLLNQAEKELDFNRRFTGDIHTGLVYWFQLSNGENVELALRKSDNYYQVFIAQLSNFD